jgi:hypothetical protein
MREQPFERHASAYRHRMRDEMKVVLPEVSPATTMRIDEIGLAHLPLPWHLPVEYLRARRETMPLGGDHLG